MDIKPEEARKLCSEAEFDLFTESVAPHLLTFTVDGLKKRAAQAQKLHELWASRIVSEKDRGWGKTGSARVRAATGYITARKKAELFEEVWKRYDARLRAVLQDPNSPLRETIKHRKSTGKLNKNPLLDD
ncbi:MAG: hypothetical protein KDB68_11995 [Planctomycetes bacterium]|nr:hypothetical protein [Planctomycetota bacterium]MCA8936911.1 hypothetical protein [Planctomycetota bacterium]MCA8945633.1 hypothetical protein [Planctomycetota bacterium]